VFAHLIQDEKLEPTYAGPRARDAFLADLPDLLTGAAN
jgi:beta-lactamase class D